MGGLVRCTACLTRRAASSRWVCVCERERESERVRESVCVCVCSCVFVHLLIARTGSKFAVQCAKMHPVIRLQSLYADNVRLLTPGYLLALLWELVSHGNLKKFLSWNRFKKWAEEIFCTRSTKSVRQSVLTFRTQDLIDFAFEGFRSTLRSRRVSWFCARSVSIQSRTNDFFTQFHLRERTAEFEMSTQQAPSAWK